MKFVEFKQYQPKAEQNVFAFVCEDDFLVQESKPVWDRIFGGGWQFEKYTAKEFEEIPAARLMDEARTPSLFAHKRGLLVTNADKLTKSRVDLLLDLRSVPRSTLKIVLTTGNRKNIEGLSKNFPVIEIDPLRPADVARWLVDRNGLDAEIARYLVENIGTDLYQLHNELEKLRTYVGDARRIQARDVDVLILRSEQFGPFELDGAVLARDYKKTVQVIGAMLDDGVDPLIVLARIVRVWRQLFIGKSLAGRRSAKEVAAAALWPAWKAGDFANACKNFEWKQLAMGFRELLYADRAFKTSTPNPEGYFDVMMWKLIG